jgi:gamma-glutamylcyclotransferase
VTPAAASSVRSLYFAYGSNMDEQQMRVHCPTFRRVDSACLHGHRLAFTRRSIVSGTGVADVVAAAGADVWGVLFEVGDGDLEALDRKEGNGWAYTREQKSVTLAGDRSAHGAILYTVLAKEPSEVPPSREYLQRLIAAAEAQGLPGEYIAMLSAVPPAL